MPTLTFDGVSKTFGSTEVIKKFTATIPDKEFLVLLGPSGCGKSTMLRMIAGLTDITGGQLRFDDSVVNELTPKKRNIAFVFQSYALYPHMTVRANIAFPLVMDNHRLWHHLPVVGALVRRAIMRRPEIAQEVERVAATLELTDYLDRKPKALSGGQRQRVALARSLIRQPSMYLLDEPLSNLDAKLRTQMRAEISALHSRVGKTFVYVTHDQVEAMTMGSRIIVLNDGVVQQQGTPKEIYNNPANVFVAKFIGAPPMNLIDVDRDRLPRLASGANGIRLRENWTRVTAAGAVPAQLGVRAERMSLVAASTDTANAHIVVVEHLGAETVIGFKYGTDGDDRALGESSTRGVHYVKLSGDVAHEIGAPCLVDFDPDDAVWFNRETGLRVDA